MKKRDSPFLYVLIILIVFFSFVFFHSELKSLSRTLVSFYGYWGLFLSVVVLDIPIQPISPVVLALGATFGDADLITASLVGGMGSCLAGVLDYSVGAKVGAKGFKRWFGEEHLTKGEELFEKYGVWAVMMGAVSPIPYSAVCWTAGIYRMKFSVFVITICLTRIPYFFFGSLVGFLL
jgi:membrane protein YqaA with SNARE-associated domain